jgi:hypothetical protein
LLAEIKRRRLKTEHWRPKIKRRRLDNAAAILH